VEPFPFPIDFQGLLDEFLGSGVLKRIDSVRLAEKTMESFRIEEFLGILKWGFLIVVIQKYHNEGC
jgi:hypothetical protein